MSYILEALKKSDQQRQRGAAPTLLSAQANVVALEQPVFRFYALLATVLVGVGMAIGWLHPWRSQPVLAEVEAVPVKPLIAQNRPRNPLPLLKLPESLPQSRPEIPLMESRPEHPVVALQSRPALKPDLPVPSRHKTVESAPKIEAPPVREKSAPAEMSSERRGGVSTGELPASIQQELPKISISGIVYSGDPEGRLVAINDQLVREGDYPAPGLRLEKIMPDGVIFSYRNYRFRRAAQ
ncbi:MAG: general secretion pathway protein GspB [Sulfuricella sp.]